ncbi:MAG TPA: hypothetical protein VGL81_27540 [Polyangiaceae bacterium]|jgi:hypothetical protein
MVDSKKRPPPSRGTELKNEGEGSRTAARRYDAGAEKMAKSGRVTELARKAKEALEGKEGDELRRAEQKGKKAELPRRR